MNTNNTNNVSSLTGFANAAVSGAVMLTSSVTGWSTVWIDDNTQDYRSDSINVEPTHDILETDDEEIQRLLAKMGYLIEKVRSSLSA